MTAKVAKKKSARVARAARPVAPVEVTLLVNGETIGSRKPEELTIANAALAIAKERGLKSFAILVDGKKVTEAQASEALAGHSTLEVFAKDTRGLI